MARTAADVLAIIPHTLGYWPARSLVMLTATSSGLGPCLRVDLPETTDFKDPGFVGEWTMQISELLEHDPVGDAVFVAVYGQPGGAVESGSRRLDSEQRTGVPVESSPWGEHAERVAHAVAEAGALSGHDFQGAWCIDGQLWWPVGDAGATHPLSEILDSAVYAALVVDGSVADPPLGCGEADGSERHPNPVDPELRRRLAHLVEPAATTQWSVRSLDVWDRILSRSACSGSHSPSASTVGLGALTQNDLLHLVAGTTDPLGCDLVLSLVLTGDMEAARRAWGEWNRSTGDDDLHGLVHTAQVMLGDWCGTPLWSRVDQCVEVVRTLIDALTCPTGTADAASTGAAGATEKGCPTTGGPSRWTVGVTAGLWVMLGHLERFRARGSRVDHCARSAESLAPGHPGVARLREIMSMRPIPHWATDPTTAWRRTRPA